MSPILTPLPPLKEQKMTTNPNSTPMLGSSLQTTSSTLLKKKREQCIKDMA